MSRKKFYDAEKVLKGASSHRRLEIIELLKNDPGLSLESIVGRLKVNYQTTSEHVARLARAGLVYKQKRGRDVQHVLSPFGVALHKFITTLLQKP